MPDATLSDPRTALIETDIASMTEDQLRTFVQDIRSKRNSQQIANENKRATVPRTAKATSPTAKAKLMEMLMGGDDDDA